MKVLIVAATKSEIISKKVREYPVLITGVGMVNTAIKLTRELIKKKYDLVINMGVAGSFTDNLKIGSVVEVVEDNFSEIGYENNLGFSKFIDFDLPTKYLNTPTTYLRHVRAITVNTVHGMTKTINQIVNRQNPEIESMEGASVFQVCEEFNITCLQIRSISNFVEERNNENWDLDLAIRNLNSEVEKIIYSL